MLELVDVHSYYGQSHVLHGVSLKAETGKITCLLGRNGMGKTTTLMSIMGVVRPASGKVLLGEKEIQRKKPYEIAHLGLTLVPEGRWVFGSLSVEENLRLAMVASPRSGSKDIAEVLKLFPDISTRQRQKGRSLSGGEQQMLVIARALVTNPTTVLLDEPSQGLAPIYVRRVGEYIAKAREQGITFLLVEQNVNMALSVADYVYLMSHGTIVYQGTPRDLADNPAILREHLAVERRSGSRVEGDGGTTKGSTTTTSQG